MVSQVTSIRKVLSFGVNKIFLLITIFLSACLLHSCNKKDAPDVVKKTGRIIHEGRNPEAFNKLELHDNIHLTIIPDYYDYIDIRAGENLIPKIISEVKDCTLVFKNENKFNFLRSYKDSIIIELHTKVLQHVYYYGSGYIKTTGVIQQKSFAFESWYGSGHCEINLNTQVSSFGFHTGFCDLTVNGSSVENRLYATEQGVIDCSGLITDKTFCHNRGIANWKVFANQEIGVEIYGDGNIYFQGDAKVVYQKHTSKGRLIHQ
jgi:hypothetical protein